MSSSLLSPSPSLISPLPSKPNKPKKPSIQKLRSNLSRLCKQGNLSHARNLFDKIPRPVPTLLFNTLLIGYVCNSLHDNALQFFSLMMHDEKPISPDSYTYSSSLKACALSNNLSLGRSIHCHVIRNHFNLTKNLVLNNSLLNMYSSVSDGTVLKVFDKMPDQNAVSYNIIIAWYVKRNMPYKAIITFTNMIKKGIKPTIVSFINIFPAIISKEINFKKGADVLYGLIIKHGQDYVNNLFIISSAINIFSETGDLQSAINIFNQAKERNIEVYNTMISGYEQNGLFSEAINLFINILDLNNVEADNLTFLSAIMAISQLQDVKIGQQIHAYLIKFRLSQLPVILNNALIVMYSRCGFIYDAYNLFDKMPQRDLVTWNTIITALVQNNLNNEGLLLTHEMKKLGFDIDFVTISALLSLSSNLGKTKLGKETHGYIIRHEINFKGIESYLIDMYAKSGYIHLARQVFDKSPCTKKDLVTYNAMLASYTQTSQNEEAWLMFDNMIKLGYKPNSVTLSCLLCICDIFEAKKIHGYAIRRDFENNIYVGTSLVDVYSKCGDILNAQKVFDKIPDKNTVLYTTMISGLGFHNLGYKAINLFKTMQEDLKIKPDSIAFLTVLSACRNSSLIDEGINLYNSMGIFGILPSPEHNCCMVDMLGINGRIQEAYEFALGLGQQGDYISIWGSLLHACRLYGNLKLGEVVYEKILKIEEEYYGENEYNESDYKVLISNLYASGENWDGVERVRKEMRERGIKKEVGFSSVSFESSKLIS